ncbi:MAG: hypothetical protein JWQ49_6238, partial [Edaphobacter sp.]|nr:hypothetical protein [Edaphobacter sp.]
MGGAETRLPPRYGGRQFPGYPQSERQTQGELHHPGIAGQRADGAHAPRTQGSAWEREHGRVCQVEHLPPELKVRGLVDTEIPHQRQVKDRAVMSAKNIDTRVADLTYR